MKMHKFAMLLLAGLVVLAQPAVAKPQVEVDEEEGVSFSHPTPDEQKFFIFGYGEFHYNNHENNDDEFDFHRFVIGIGYDFSEKIRLRAEVDFEHGFAEPYIEYAYIDFDIIRAINFRMGSILLPIGYLNQNHEPSTFYSVERPEIYNRIIPASWPEGGGGIFGEIIDGLSYQLYVHSSLDYNQGYMGDTGFSAGSGLRGGRGKVSETSGNDFAGSGRLQYTGVKGLRVGASGFVGQTSQGDTRVSGGLVSIVEGDAKYSFHGFEIEGLVAVVFNPDAGEMTTAQRADGNIGATDTIGERMFGYMFEGAYHVFHHLWPEAPSDLIAFVRWEDYDTQHKLPSGFTGSGANHRQIITTGLSFKPVHNVAIKADYTFRDNDAGTANNQFNLGLGYNF